MKTKRHEYLGIVEEVHPKYVEVRLSIGGVDITQQFTRGVMDYHKLSSKGAAFVYHAPKANRDLTIKDVKPYKSKRISLKDLKKGLESLCNPKNAEFV